MRHYFFCFIEKEILRYLWNWLSQHTEHILFKWADAISDDSKKLDFALIQTTDFPIFFSLPNL